MEIIVDSNEKRFKRLRIVTYNIHMGLSPFRKRDVLDAMETVLLDTKADILCLQEDLQVDDVSDTQMALRCQKVWGDAVFGKTVLHPRGAQGNSILSKYPMVFSETLELPNHGAQPRSLVRASIDCGAFAPIEVICIHFGLSEKQRKSQTLAALNYIDQRCSHHHPVLIAGDFNDRKGKLSEFLQQERGFREARSAPGARQFSTFPAWMPFLALDRILYRGCDLESASVFSSSGRLGRSDHLPVIADLKVGLAER